MKLELFHDDDGDSLSSSEVNTGFVKNIRPHDVEEEDIESLLQKYQEELTSTLESFRLEETRPSNSGDGLVEDDDVISVVGHYVFIAILVSPMVLLPFFIQAGESKSLSFSTAYQFVADDIGTWSATTFLKFRHIRMAYFLFAIATLGIACFFVLLIEALLYYWTTPLSLLQQAECKPSTGRRYFHAVVYYMVRYEWVDRGVSFYPLLHVEVH